MRIEIHFTDAEAIAKIADVWHPLPADPCLITPEMRAGRQRFMERFAMGEDHACLEFNTDTMMAILLPVKDWAA